MIHGFRDANDKQARVFILGVSPRCKGETKLVVRTEEGPIVEMTLSELNGEHGTRPAEKSVPKAGNAE
jgi:hypothetical protein